MRFTTFSGSLYEVDTTAKKIRRLNGKKDPTPRQGKDGEWRGYLGELEVKVGYPVFIQWEAEHAVTEETKAIYEDMGAEPPPPYKGSLTTTSYVVEVDETVYN